MVPVRVTARRRPWLWASLAVVLAFLLTARACGGGNSTLLWTLDGRTISGGDFLRPTMWATGATLAITRAREVTGYDAATGEVRWSVPLAGRVCAASARPAGDRVAVQFGQGRHRCDRVAAVDLKGGRKLWEQPMPSAERVGEGQVVVSEDVVVVDEVHATAAFRLDDGRPLWDRNSRDVDCAIQGLASGPALVAGQTCDADKGKVRRVEGIDPDSGRAQWRYDAPPGYVVKAMVSSRPVVLGLDGDGPGGDRSRYVVLGPSGDQITSIDIAGKSPLLCYRGPHRCNNIVATGDSLYIRANVRPVKDEKERTFAPVASFDLATGRARWSTENPGGNHLFPVGMDGGRLIAAQPKTAGGARGQQGEPPRLVSVDPATGKTSIMWSLTRKSDFRVRSGADRLYAQDRFFLMKQLVTGKEGTAFRAFGRPDE
ncbi:hypothetical protein E1281_18025 [Actinomadura sp. KC345]|nr:hypothetical protein E1281_18025 [Actinomadura sp. KC345]